MANGNGNGRGRSRRRLALDRAGRRGPRGRRGDRRAQQRQGARRVPHRQGREGRSRPLRGRDRQDPAAHEGPDQVEGERHREAPVRALRRPREGRTGAGRARPRAARGERPRIAREPARRRGVLGAQQDRGRGARPSVPEARARALAQALRRRPDRAVAARGRGQGLPDGAQQADRGEEPGRGEPRRGGEGPGDARARAGGSALRDDHEPDGRPRALARRGGRRRRQLDPGARLAGDARDDARRRERGVRARQGGRGGHRQGLFRAARADRGRVVQGQAVRGQGHQDLAARRGEGQRHDLRGARLDPEPGRRAQDQHDRQRRGDPRGEEGDPHGSRVRGALRQGAQALARGARSEGEGRQAQGGGEARDLERREGRARRGAQRGRSDRAAVAMVFSDLIRDTLRTLFAHKLRTLLTMFGIAWGIVSITLMVAAGEGLRVGQAKVASAFSKDVMIVFAGRTSLQAGGLRAGRRIQWTATDHVDDRAAGARVRLRDARAGAGRSGAQRLQQRQPHDHGLAAGVRAHPLDRRGRGPLPGLGRREGRAARGAHRQRREEAALRQPAGDGRDGPHRRLPVHDRRRDAAQGAGLELRRPRHQQAVPAVQRDPAGLPEQAAGRARTRSTGCWWRPARSRTTRPARRSCGARSARIHNFDPADEEAAKIWDTVQEAAGLSHHDRRDEVLPGRDRDRDAVHRRDRRDERDAGGGARADARDRDPQGARRHAPLDRAAVRGGDGIVVFVSGGAGLGFAYGLCALVNLLPMPQFFAGLLPTLSSGVLAFALLGTIALLGGRLPGAARGLDRPDRGAALRGGRLACSASSSPRAGPTSRATARAARSPCSGSCGASSRSRVLIAYGAGFRAILSHAFDAFGKSAVVAWPGQTSEQAGGERAGRRVRFERADRDAIEAEASLVKGISMETVQWRQISYGDSAANTAVRGVEPIYGEIRNERPSDGRWLSPEDSIERRRVVFLGSQLRKKLFQGRPAVGETIRIDGMRFTVVGAMDRKMQMSNYFTSDDECAFIPYTTAGDLWDTRYVERPRLQRGDAVAREGGDPAGA